ncbi:hypothetical protein JB92DRAFT_3077263 [Gautieria morchelliformis]|nr:hypothetical protein JB92DRAFT_3077263 [Gautieria morchelliformis]
MAHALRLTLFRSIGRGSLLLAICAGAAASGSVTRTFTFPLPDRAPKPTVVPDSFSSSTPRIIRSSALILPKVEGGMDEFTVLLRDAPLESSDFSSVGAQTWGGSCILAEMIAENPQTSLYFRRSTRHLTSRQCALPSIGTGCRNRFASLVLGKVLERIRSMDRQCEEPISFDTRRAADFHPSVLANLRFNFAVNSQLHQSTPNRLHKWPNDADALFQSRPQTSHPVLDQTDLIRDRQQVLANNANILTSAPSSTSSMHLTDIIYEHSHALWVRACVERFLRKPTRPSSPGHSYQSDTSPLRTDQRPIPHSSIYYPLRRTHAVESRSVEEVFRPAADIISSRKLSQHANVPHTTSPYADAAMEPIPLQIAIIRQEDILRDAYSDCETEEVVYRYYRIGWV